MDKLNPEISSVCRLTDFSLWDAYDLSLNGSFESAGKGHFLFPRYRGSQDQSLRVSEQEARFAFVESLRRSSFLYSVEAPTNKLYQFTGSTPMSAQSDLAIHDEAGQRICNVEFKAKGISPSANKHIHIYKDFQKLLREPIWGLWFHLLESVNNSTINDLLCVMHSQICKVQQEFKYDAESPGLTIHICVLQHGFSLQKDLSISPDIELSPEDSQLDLVVSRSELLRANNLKGWNIHRRADL
jgi:hypothetical protein